MATEKTVDLGIPGLDDAVLIGRGGFATVFRAYQPAFRRTVAVKVVSVTHVDERTRERFQRECQAMGLLSEHPSIVTVLEAGFLDDGRPYLVMAYMPEGSLQDRLHHEGPIGWQEATRIGIKLAGALDTAHHAGILHRDLKPANVLMSQYGEPQLADFGIARIAGGPETSSGVITASLAYAPVEIVEGKRPTVESDVYSLAATIHALLSGNAPYWRTGDDSVAALLHRVVNDPVPDLRPQGVPDEVCTVLERAMSKDPAQRFASAADLARALRDAQQALGVRPTDLTLYTPPEKKTKKVAEPEPTQVGTSPPTEEPPPVEPTVTTAVKPDRRWWYAGGAAALVAVAVIIGAIALSGGDDPQAGTTITTTGASTTTTAGPTTTVTDAGALEAYNDGLSYLEAGAYQRAAEEFKKAVDSDPANPDYQLQYAIARFRQAWDSDEMNAHWDGGSDEIIMILEDAETSLEATLRAEPANTTALEYYALVAYDLAWNSTDRNDLAEIAVRAQDFVDVAPDDWRSWRIKALADGRLADSLPDRRQEAMSAAWKAIELGANDQDFKNGIWGGIVTGTWHDLAEMYVVTGTGFLAQDYDTHLQDAIIEFGHCLTLYAQDHECLFYRAGAHAELGNQEEAAADYRAFLVAPEAQTWKSGIVVANEYLAEAAEAAEETFANAQEQLRLGNRNSAIIGYNRAIALDPTVAEYYKQRAVARILQVGEFTDDILADIEMAYGLDPQDWEVPYLGAYLGQLPQGNAQVVVEWAERGLAITTDQWQLYSLLGRGHWEDGRNPESISALEAAIALLSPATAAAWDLECCGLYDVATWDLLAAVRLAYGRSLTGTDPTEAQAQFQGAIAAAEGCLALNPADPTYQASCNFYWAGAAAGAGDSPTAVAKYREAIDTGHLWPEAIAEAEAYIAANS